MASQLFRVLNVCWAMMVALIVGAACVLQQPEVHPSALAGAVFWLLYLVIAVGIFLENRVAWVVGAVQLVAIWLLMGAAVSQSSFSFLTGQEIGVTTHAVSVVVFRSLFGLLLPASGLLILLLLSSRHLAHVLRDRPRRAEVSAASAPRR